MEHYYTQIQGWFDDRTLYEFAVNKYENARFVEIGCWKGRSTTCMGVEIINSKKHIILDCVDTFEGSAEHGTVDKNALYNKFIQNIQPIKQIIGNIHAMKSVDAAELYEDKSLDFVFIDASHDYKSVIQDIISWLPKIKPGGIISGDDLDPDWPDVERALLHIFGENNYKSFGRQWYREL